MSVGSDTLSMRCASSSPAISAFSPRFGRKKGAIGSPPIYIKTGRRIRVGPEGHEGPGALRRLRRIECGERATCDQRDNAKLVGSLDPRPNLRLMVVPRGGPQSPDV